MRFAWTDRGPASAGRYGGLLRPGMRRELQRSQLDRRAAIEPFAATERLLCGSNFARRLQVKLEDDNDPILALFRAGMKDDDEADEYDSF